MERPPIPEAGPAGEPTAGFVMLPVPPFIMIKVEPVQARLVGGGTSAVVSGVLSGAHVPEGAIVVTPESAATGL